MQELIKLQTGKIGEEAIQTVNARDLHEFLESGQEFRHWIKARIEQYGFVEGQDYVTSENIIRGGKAIEYHISINMAKELAMVERNAQGRVIRQYFIECERKALSKPVALDDPAALRTLLLGYTEKVIALEQKVEQDAPKVVGYLQLVDSSGYFSRRTVAKMLKLKQHKLNRWLEEIGHWNPKEELPGAYALEHDYAVVLTTTNTQGHTHTRALITVKGLERYRQRMNRGECDAFLDTGNARLNKQLTTQAA
jgi:anti-repressor protein